jgi:hypothetical protein
MTKLTEKEKGWIRKHAENGYSSSPDVIIQLLDELQEAQEELGQQKLLQDTKTRG